MNIEQEYLIGAGGAGSIGILYLAIKLLTRLCRRSSCQSNSGCCAFNMREEPVEINRNNEEIL